MSTFTAALLGTALVFLALVALAALSKPHPPKPCSECGLPLRRRDVVDHFLDFHNSPTRSPR